MYRHFYFSEGLVRFCGAKKKDVVVVAVRQISKKESSPYWAWWNSKEKRFSIVQPTKVQLEICFPYGPEAEEKMGKGKRINVKVSECKVKRGRG
jgi:hypothetical protein